MTISKKTSTVGKLAAIAAISLAANAANAASYVFEGTIESCTGICAIFTAVGQSATFAFTGDDGPGLVSAGSVTDVAISLSTVAGGSLDFVDGVALGSDLMADANSNPTGGTITLQGTGSTTGIVAQGTVDAATGTWVAYVVSASDGSLEQVASGSGAFVVNEVPIPAAGWLFGSAVLGLCTVRRRKAA